MNGLQCGEGSGVYKRCPGAVTSLRPFACRQVCPIIADIDSAESWLHVRSAIADAYWQSAPAIPLPAVVEGDEPALP